MNKNSLIYTIIFSFIVTFAFVFLLALANEGTKDIVQQNQRLEANRAVLSALGIDFNPTDRNEVFSRFEEVNELTSEEGLTYYRANVEGETVYALQTNGAGLWGNIELVIGFNEDVTRFKGLEVIDQNETPGLGGRITEDWYSSQFVNQAIPQDVASGNDKLALAAGDGRGDDNKDDAKVDAITGATRTSESMQTIVSRAAAEMNSILGGM